MSRLLELCKKDISSLLIIGQIIALSISFCYQAIDRECSDIKGLANRIGAYYKTIVIKTILTFWAEMKFRVMS